MDMFFRWSRMENLRKMKKPYSLKMPVNNIK